MQRTLKVVAPDASMSSIFNFDGVDITVQKDGDEIWFRGKDVAEALGYKRPDNAVRNHVDEDDRRKVMQTITKNDRLVKSMFYQINEPGVYSLVFSSKLPSAKRFRNWMTKNVIPSAGQCKYIEPPLRGGVFRFGDKLIRTYKDGDEIWFRGKDVAEALGYERPDKAIRDHVNSGDIANALKTPQNSAFSGRWINEPGVYSLVFSSKLPSAEKFKNWVFRDVLPSIRKTGQYIAPRLIGNQLSLMNENDLHYQVIRYIRKYHPSSVVIPGLGENQDTNCKRITSWKKGYRVGQPDIIIGNLHKTYSGLAIELKTPNGTGVLSDRQKSFIDSLGDNGYRTLVSCNYDEIHRCIDEYMTEVRVRCGYCGRKFRNKDTLSNHRKYFHRISYTSET